MMNMRANKRTKNAIIMSSAKMSPKKTHAHFRDQTSVQDEDRMNLNYEREVSDGFIISGRSTVQIGDSTNR